jgi:signal transduction histidine kinase
LLSVEVGEVDGSVMRRFVSRPACETESVLGDTGSRRRGALYVGSLIRVAGLYYGSGKLGLEIAYLNGAVSAMWPPVGVGVGAVYLLGLRVVPGVVAADLLLGDYSTPLATVVAQTLGNTVAVVAAALLLRRLIGNRAPLDDVREVLAVVVVAAVAAAVSACFGPTSLWLGDVISGGEVADVFRTWFLGDMAGALVVLPLVLTWASVRYLGSWRMLVEALVLLAILVLLVELPAQRDVPYVVFPLLILAALRFGPRGAATATALVSFLAVWNTARSAGPFVRDSITHSLLASQLFIATAALTSLVLAALTAERRRAEAAVRDLAEEQAALRRVATLVASEADPDAVFERVTEEAGRLLGTPSATIVRYESTDSATIVGGWAEAGTPLIPVGSTISRDRGTVIGRVYETGEPQRVESYAGTPGPLAQTLRELGYRSSVAAPVKVGGRLWGALLATTRSPEPLPEGSERRLGDFADLVAQAIANADAYEQLAASRARIVEAGDAERRRLERNLHDGAQQRLVALALQMRVADSMVDDDPEEAHRLVADAQAQLSAALDELRELARGIHPAVLTERGLEPALRSLTQRAPVPVEIEAVPNERLPEAVEAAAYYVAAEAITNAAKYANASHVTVRVSHSNGRAVVRVADDGVGGADPAGGSGLHGLADRVEALSGRLQVDSPPNGGTRIKAEIPL